MDELDLMVIVLDELDTAIEAAKVKQQREDGRHAAAVWQGKVDGLVGARQIMWAVIEGHAER